MILYGITLVHLVEILCNECLEVMQLWYADDLTLLGRHTANAHFLKLLTKAGLFFGYYPNPGKSWHICSEEDKDNARAAFDAAGMDIQFTLGQQNVGRIIGFDATCQEWLVPMIQQWVDDIKTLAVVASSFQQTACAGMGTNLQAKW